MGIVSTLVASCPGLEAIAWGDLEPGDDWHRNWHDRLTASCYPHETPGAIAFPRTQAELATAARVACENGWRVIPCGRGSKLHWGGLVRGAALAISTEKLDRVVEHAADDFTLTVEAGVAMATIDELLRARNQRLAIDPTRPESATIGGVVATADTGSLRQRYGGLRDRLIGIQFVRHDGEIAKAGGRVVKNVAGYDLMKLFTGSYGTLGTIAQLTFRLYPVPEASQTTIAQGEPEDIDRFARAIASSSLTPVAFDLIGPSLVQSLELGGRLAAVLKFETVEASLADQSQRTLELAERCGLRVRVCDEREAENFWAQGRDRLDRATDEGCTVKFGTRSTAAIEALLACDRLFKDNSAAIVHYRSGLGRAAIARDLGGNRLANWRRVCEDNGGFLSVLSAPLALRHAASAGQLDLWGARDGARRVMGQIAARFDPDRRYSPGRFLV